MREIFGKYKKKNSLHLAIAEDGGVPKKGLSPLGLGLWANGVVVLKGSPEKSLFGLWNWLGLI